MTVKMRRFTVLAAAFLLASAAKAQDTTVVIVRHLPAQQDTNVVVRHLAPPQAPAPAPARVSGQRMAPPYGAPRYALRSGVVVAKDPYTGTMLSFIFPGGGQYYAGAEAKGIALTLIAIGAPIIGYANVDRRDANWDGYGPPPPGYNCPVLGGGPLMYGGGSCRRHTDYTPAAIGLGVGITAWLYGLATAGSDVQRWNRAHGVRFVTAPGRAGFAVALP